MKIFKLTAILGLLVLGTSACNTVDGIGQDLERGGEKISDAAHKHQ